MRVLKFGGTSVGCAENIKQVEKIVKNHAVEDSVVVVVSAFGGVTDMLMKTCKLAVEQDESYKTVFQSIQEKHIDIICELLPVRRQSSIIANIKKQINQLEVFIEGIYAINEISDRTLDKVLPYGELLSSYIISQYFIHQGLDACKKDSRELIITDEKYTQANVQFKITNINCISYFRNVSKSQVVVLPGFIAFSESENTTTLGRGGSDYTAAIIAAAIEAKVLEIWTDVSGMFTANPKLVKQARPIAKLSYMEAMELSHFGAKVLYPPTIHPILEKKIPLYIKNTLSPTAVGTFISQQGDTFLDNPIKGISYIDKMALLTLEGSGIIGVSGISKRFFGILSDENINVVLITQASSEHSICICINQKTVNYAKSIVDKAFKYDIQKGKVNPCKIEKGLAILAVVGDGMRNYQGIGGRMFTTLGRNNVNIRAIAQGASERNISVVIGQGDASKALNVLHESFFEDNIKLLNLFITGVGNVGQKLINQLHSQKKYLRENFKLNLKVVAISNSKKMYFDQNGIDLLEWKTLVEKGQKSDKEFFFQNVKILNLRNSVFIDNTANVEISETYEKYLKTSIAVVTCNKIACSSRIENYKYLKSLSQKYKAPLLFETNVGAALPIIDTLKNLMASGDEIQEIQAVLSGSLNFIFNNFNAHNSFHDVVKQAKDEGYTEPNPMIDLSGIDVARKILILIRECGHDKNIEDIEKVSFLPEETLKTKGLEDLFKSLERERHHFEKMYKSAKDNNCVLKYVASYKEGEARVGLKEIAINHPFYNLEGKDNIVLFYTKRYAEQPLIIKGAGAGAEVTASGIFADIIRVSNIGL